jgi:hypothetical protein
MALQIREALMDISGGEVLSQGGWQDTEATTREDLLADLQETWGDRVQPLMLKTTKPDGEHLPVPAQPIAARRDTTVTDSGWIFTNGEPCPDGSADVHEVWVEVRDEPDAEPAAEHDMEAG